MITEGKTTTGSQHDAKLIVSGSLPLSDDDLFSIVEKIATEQYSSDPMGDMVKKMGMLRQFINDKVQGENGLLAAVFSVECCSRCPFYEYQDEMMDSSCRADENLIFGYWKRVYKWVNKEVHHSCPLKKGSIAVHLKNGS